ncbi:PQQ-dependent catabolism-associated CXXCW motif protein [Pseudomonas protegens]|jgi:PQQ-dependent catabolism-associated CXXCW motif protein|uniref:Rhodanese domain-containing protein n=2 Tax=Pseudomonas protegens TaxID=380021 RepID=Q4KEM1_PSEF5|nr:MULTISPECIES: PQQ-dependent catabolism-associated CXXCW motif protein [Pseudomonas]AAY91479.1 conserved hypothetical protein [Pseudomonas protegens Pf-5]ASE24275.1 PQQ-dependent catabolism-associated CXXCW motif protein [Pseudomonas protegens]MBB1611007.1 sulfurtransferase [Pseudomonas sp. UMC65]MBB1617947.1 sulfurtransferase [Pseudomonas sp. UME65]MBB1622173.1 sulfurtransferase [Pseudomonas sp. UME65]
MPRALETLAALTLSLALGAAHAAAPLFSAEGYRTSLYRSPTPLQIDQGRIIDTPGLQELLKEQPAPLLIDVYRRQWLQGRFIDSEPHANLPGSHWLANTGDGELSPEWQAYFAGNLQRLSHADPQRALVFYCRADCWLSWNAVKRAAALGYKNIYWYRDGLDAWEAAGLPVEAARPQPFP